MKKWILKYDCPIDDDDNLVFICESCFTPYLIPRRECDLTDAYKDENGRIVYQFRRVCPNCYRDMHTTVSMQDNKEE